MEITFQSLKKEKRLLLYFAPLIQQDYLSNLISLLFPSLLSDIKYNQVPRVTFNALKRRNVTNLSTWVFLKQLALLDSGHGLT